MQLALAAAALVVLLLGGVEVAWSQSGRTARSLVGAQQRENWRRDYSDRQKNLERNRSAEADARLRLQEKRDLRQQSEKEHTASEKAVRAMKKGLGPAPAGSVQTQYSDSSQVRRERQQKVTKRVSQGVTLEDLKRTPRRVDWDRGDAFLVEQRDGSMMLVDPRLSQQVR